MIKLSGKEYPIRFDYMTLKEVYERYKSIKDFQMQLLGMEIVGKDSGGKNQVQITKLPSLRLLLFLIPLMINTALDYQGKERLEDEKIIKRIDGKCYNLAYILHEEVNKCFKNDIEITENQSDSADKTEEKLNFAEILYLCKNKLGYTTHEAKHIYLGEYVEQYEVYKKYHNIEINRLVFPETDEKMDEKQTNEEELPKWYHEYMASQKG